MSVLLLLFCLAAPSHAAPTDMDFHQAESLRLSSEIQSLARRDHWVGVEHTYEKAVANGLSLGLRDHLAGASAALAIGDVEAARERLMAARDIEVDREVIETLWSIDTQFARVDLVAERDADLRITDMPFHPHQAHAIAFARASLAETGRFCGYLPAGDYTIDGRTFTVRVAGAGGHPVVVEALTARIR